MSVPVDGCILQVTGKRVFATKCHVYGVLAMQPKQTNATDERIVGRDSAPAESVLIDVEQVAAILRCSTRHVYRLADAAKMPRPLKLGALVRWRRSELLDWIDASCPPHHTWQTMQRGGQE